MGVIGMNLADRDEVVGMQMQSQGESLMIVSERGLGKCTMMSEFTAQIRGGKGVKCYKIIEKTGELIGMKAVTAENEIMMINTEGIVIRMECRGISVLGRITSGVKLINLRENEIVASIAKVKEKEEEEEFFGGFEIDLDAIDDIDFGEEDNGDNDDDIASLFDTMFDD